MGEIGIELRVFGAPALCTPGGELLLAPRRPHQPLAFLACRCHWVARAELAQLFWPDRGCRRDDEAIERTHPPPLGVCAAEPGSS
jgi:hypothetical protein